MLELTDVVAGYGSVPVLHGVSLRVDPGEIVSIIGANGAGKSTICRVVSGLLRPRSGRVVLAGRDVTGTPAHEITRLGVGQVPEGRQVFGTLTVEDNLLLAAHFGGGKAPKGRPEAQLDEVYQLFPVLRERKRQRAGTLSGGQQQMVAIARALMTRPRLLVLDEPSLGLAPLIVRDIFAVIHRLNQKGMSILLIEQNAHAALRISHRAYVLEQGRIPLAGPAGEVMADEQVRFLYLGKRAEHARG